MKIIYVLFLYSLLPIAYGHSSAICTELFKNGSFVHRWFNPVNKICCGQKLRQRTTYLDCCNEREFFFSNEQICCNGVVSNKTVSRRSDKRYISCEKDNSDCVERICCGDELLPKEDNVFCCDGTKIILTKDQVKNKDFLKCCGKKEVKKEVYNTQTHMCCHNVMPLYPFIGCCNGNVFNTKKFKCVNGVKMEKAKGRCGNDSFDRMKDSCCEDRLIKNVPTISKSEDGDLIENQCCGSNITSTEEICCEKQLYGFPTHSIPKHSDLKCCGSGYYNVTTHFCLDGNPIKRSFNQSQCGKYLIDNRVESCCANKLPYDNSTEKCCEGAFYCVVKKEEHCCNGLPMKANELCCENVKPCMKLKKEDNECCFDYERNNGTTYNKELWACNRGKLIRIPRGNSLCGLNYFNPKEEFCCNGKKYKNGNGQCCNGVHNDIPPKKGSCCSDDNKAYKFGDYTNPCIEKCNERESFDINTELCCDGRKFNNTDNKYCCGANAIGGRTRCCGTQFPYRLRSRKQCCHDTQVYNKKYSICKEDGRLEFKGVLRELSDVQKLCHPLALKLFDGGVQQACMRNYGIAGRISRIVSTFKTNSEIHLLISLRRVNTLKTLKVTELSRRFTLSIHIPANECQLKQFKKLKRVIAFFDNEPNKITRTVEIWKNSPFYLNPKTRLRYYSVTKAISKNLCKIFS